MITKLGDVITEYSVRNKNKENIPVYSVTNEQGFCTGYFSKDVASKDRTTYKIVPKGYFAYNPSRINVGSVDWQDCEERVIVSPLYVVFGVNKNLDQQYLLHYLKSDIALTYIKAFATGSVRDNLKFSVLQELPINLRPIDEQRKIASVLDHINRVIELRKKELSTLDALIKSRFIELFGEPELNPRDLPVLPWGAVFQTTTGKLDSNAMVENGRYPFFTCAKESYKIDSYAFDCEALLLAGNNAAGIYDVKHYKGKFNAYQRTYVLRLMNEKWSYILFKRQLEDKLRYLQSQSKGTNTRYLTLGILNELRFVVPPIAEQERFTAFVEQTDKSKYYSSLSFRYCQAAENAYRQEWITCRTSDF